MNMLNEARLLCDNTAFCFHLKKNIHFVGFIKIHLDINLIWLINDPQFDTDISVAHSLHMYWNSFWCAINSRNGLNSNDDDATWSERIFRRMSIFFSVFVLVSKVLQKQRFRWSVVFFWWDVGSSHTWCLHSFKETRLYFIYFAFWRRIFSELNTRIDKITK